MSALTIANFEHKIRRLMSQMLPPDLFIRTYSETRTWFLDMLSTSNPKALAPKYPVEIRGVKFRNDLGNAAGMDKDGYLLPFNYHLGAGFGVVGTVLPYEHRGNLTRGLIRKVNPWTPLPHSDSALNSLGLPSHGIDKAIRNIEEFRDKYQPLNFPIIMNIMPHPKDTGEKRNQNLISCFLKALKVADMIEINYSCPNTQSHDEWEQINKQLKEMVALRNSISTTKYVPLGAKLRDFGADSQQTIEFFTETGIDFLAGINSQPKTRIRYLEEHLHPNDRKIFNHYVEKYGEKFGFGATGKVIRDISFEEIGNASKAIEKSGSHLQLIHIGGIGEPEEVQLSRRISPVVKLREWYTRQFTALSTYSPEKLYERMVA